MPDDRITEGTRGEKLGTTVIDGKGGLSGPIPKQATSTETYRIRQVSTSWSVSLSRLFCECMQKIYNTTPRRSFRRWVRQLFSNLMKRQNRNYLEDILEKLKDIEDSIDIIMREIARQIKSGK